MGKKRTIQMDQSQEQQLDQQTTNKYKKKDAFNLPDEFAELEALYAREKAEDQGEDQDEKKSQASTTVRRKRIRSKKFLDLKKQIDQDKKYPISQALDQVDSVAQANFDETVELHIEAKRGSLSGKVKLPHGNGKEKKVAIFDEKTLKQIEDQNIDFDVLLAKPEDMSKIAKHAKYLGPRGLMPNPKNGTITSDPKSAIKEFTGGNLQYKTEKKAPLIHLNIGKSSFENQKLKENIIAVIKAVDPKLVKSAHICSTMGPSVKLDLSALKEEDEEK